MRKMRTEIQSRSRSSSPSSAFFCTLKRTLQRFFAAVRAHELDRPHDKVADALVRYSGPPAADGGIRLEMKHRITGEFPSWFTIATVREVLPDAPEHTIRRVLNALRDDGVIASSGKGKGSYWEITV